MQIEQLKTEDLLSYARNSRTHSEAQVDQIAASIKEFGFTNPVLIDNENQIIAGHGRVMAARKLKLGEVPCIRLGYLTETQKKAYVIADNKLALNAGWDDELLALEIAELKDEDFEINILGFSVEELILINEAANKNFEPATEKEQGKLDKLDPKWICCPKCGSEFDARQV